MVLPFTRRNILKLSIATLATGFFGGKQFFAQVQQNSPASVPSPRGPYTLPPLPYAYDALEPHIDAETMHIHHDKHHQAYITNANKLLIDQPELAHLSPEELLKNLNKAPESIRTGLRNNVGGHVNHSQFWRMMSPKGGGKPTGPLAKAIEETFGSFENFQEQFRDAALKRFGSGWTWLVLSNGKLRIVSTANQDSPILENQISLLGLDVWEHAYYLKYQNRRPDYIDAWWNVVNWPYVEEQFATTRQRSIGDQKIQS